MPAAPSIFGRLGRTPWNRGRPGRLIVRSAPDLDAHGRPPDCHDSVQRWSVEGRRRGRGRACSSESAQAFHGHGEFSMMPFSVGGVGGRVEVEFPL